MSVLQQDPQVVVFDVKRFTSLNHQQEQQPSKGCCHLDDDTKQELQAKFGLYLNGFMNVMGCLLVIFVPQRCEVGECVRAPALS
jgi:hypothetical protein